MKILNINSYYYSSTVHKQLDNALSKLKLNFMTYAPVARGYTPREECKYDQEDYVKKVECYNEIDRYIFHLKHSKILKNIVEEIDIDKYDCLHAHSLFSNGYIAMKLKERLRKPYFVTVRNTDVNVFFKRMIHLRGLGNKILREADGVIFLSKPYKMNVIDKYVKKKYKNSILAKSYVIPNGIDEFWLANKSIPKTLESPKHIKLLYVGAISKQKNILTTIEAIKILKQKGYEPSLTVVGKVVDKKIYNEILKYEFVQYISPKPKEELLKIYRESDIFVMPSIAESFGLVYPEAMSQGLPVIYTRGQGFDGQFEDGEVGYSVNCFDADEIADRIIRITNEYENISKRSVDLSSIYNWEEIAKRYKDLYTSLKL